MSRWRQGIIVIVGVAFIWGGWKSFRSQMALDASKKEKFEELKSQVRVTVGDSVFSSSGKHPYKISAQSVTQEDGGMYYLNNISGIYTIEPHGLLNLFATDGSIDSLVDVAKFTNGVKLRYLGYELVTGKLDVDFKNYSAMAPGYVTIKGEESSIAADAFHASEEFNLITFHGNVKADFILHNSH